MPVPKLKDSDLTPRAGQVYRAKARKGFRYIHIEQVRGLNDHSPYVLWHEVSVHGNPLKGKDANGIDRGLLYSTPLIWNDGWRMPPSYELVEEKSDV